MARLFFRQGICLRWLAVFRKTRLSAAFPVSSINADHVIIECRIASGASLKRLALFGVVVQTFCYLIKQYEYANQVKSNQYAGKYV